MTLADDLNELALANSEGLLNDDEYRLLRQNLFERYTANGAGIPTEVPVVPVAAQLRGPPIPSASQRKVVNFRVDSPISVASPPPPLRSKRSLTSGMSNLLKRATGRSNRPTTQTSTSTSTVPTNSSAPNLFERWSMPRALSRKGSMASSLRTEASRARTDSHSVYSRTTDGASEGRTLYDTPPASPVHSKHFGTPTKYNIPSTTSISHIFDDEALITVDDIRRRIISVEMERKRLVDAFDRLEQSSLARLERQEGRRTPSVVLSQPRMDRRHERQNPSTSSLLAESTASRRSPSETEIASVVSKKFIRKAPSFNSLRKGKPTAISSAQPLRPPSLRKNSISSMSSQGASSLSVARLPVSSSSSFSTGHLPLSPLAENGHRLGSSDTVGTVGMLSSEYGESDNQIIDIRRRKDELNTRYEARLEYLRAKLKGAQIHEKLLKN